MKLNKVLKLLNEVVDNKPEIGEMDVKLANQLDLTYDDLIDFAVIDEIPSDSFVILSTVPLDNWCSDVIETTHHIKWNV